MHWYDSEQEGSWTQAWASKDENQSGVQSRLANYWGYPNPEDRGRLPSEGRVALDEIPPRCFSQGVFFLGTDGVTKVLKDRDLLDMVRMANGDVATLGELIHAGIVRRPKDDYAYVVGDSKVLLNSGVSFR